MHRIVLLLAFVFVLACAGDPVRPPSDGGTDASDADTGTGPVDSSLDAPSDTDAGGVEAGFGVLSLNLHCLETDSTRFADNAARFAAIAAEALARGVRVLLLQEVCGGALSALEAAFETASSGEWHGAYSFAHVAWEGTARETDEGVGILADVPLADSESFVHLAEGSLRRVVVSAVLGGDLPALRVASFHLDHADDAARLVQARELATVGLLHAGSADVMLGGDLNDRAGAAPHAALLDAGYRDGGDTLPASRIDHVFVHRGASVRALSAELLFEDDPVSDHPGVLVYLDAATAESAPLTTIEVDADVGLGNALFIRGDQAPLSWDEGWPTINAGAGFWRFATTELSGSFEYKVLRNDVDWSAGENFSGTAGATNSVTVGAFE